MDVVTTAKTARGIDTISRTKGAMAYSGFHTLNSTLSEPVRSNILVMWDVWSEEQRKKSCVDHVGM